MCVCIVSLNECILKWHPPTLVHTSLPMACSWSQEYLREVAVPKMSTLICAIRHPKICIDTPPPLPPHLEEVKSMIPTRLLHCICIIYVKLSIGIYNERSLYPNCGTDFCTFRSTIKCWFWVTKNIFVPLWRC